MKLPPHTYKKISEPDICNICLSPAKLTLDHVPPRSALPVAHAKVQPLFRHSGRHRLSQGGVKFRTLCQVCNGERLGTDYDKALLEMVRQARRLHRNSSLLVQTPSIEIDPGKVVRAVFGHLLAAKDHTPRSRADEQMRAFFMDRTSVDPGDLNILYWAHPDRSIRMARDTVVIDFDGPQETQQLRLDMLVWYPVGFIVCDRIPSHMSSRPPLNMPHMNHHLGQRVAHVPLRALASGVLEAWLNRTGKVTGAPATTAYQAEHPRRIELEK